MYVLCIVHGVYCALAVCKKSALEDGVLRLKTKYCQFRSIQSLRK